MSNYQLSHTFSKNYGTPESGLTRFRRKRHSRYISLRELITNAVGFKKNSERHIFKIQDLPFPIANSKLLQHIIN